MFNSSQALLFVAHPSHELLIHGWLDRAKPRVCALTDGSGHAEHPRIGASADLLRDLGATPGRIFGRFTDREMYSVILNGEAELIDGLVNELAGEIVSNGVALVVADAMEGFNPVHDLCRMIAGAACSRAGSIPYFEYPIHDGPHAFDALSDATITDLDDAAFRAKIERARAFAPILADIDEMLSRFGEAPFRREAFRRITDWTVSPWGEGEHPLYEKIGAERVALHRYHQVIR